MRTGTQKLLGARVTRGARTGREQVAGDLRVSEKEMYIT